MYQNLEKILFSWLKLKAVSLFCILGLSFKEAVFCYLILHFKSQTKFVITVHQQSKNHKPFPFQERVLSVKGGKEFLVGVGFAESALPFGDSQTPEPFLVIPESIAKQTEMIVQAKEVLQQTETVPLKLHRNVEVRWK